MVRWNRFVPCIVPTLLIWNDILVVSHDMSCCMAYRYTTPSTQILPQRRRPSIAFGYHKYQLVPRIEKSLKSHGDRNNQHDGLLQQLIEPFDRWRYLQKLLDEDINDASEILFLLQTSVLLQLRQTPQSDASTSSVPVLPSGISPTNETLSPLAPTATALPGYDDNRSDKATRRRIMEYIINDVSPDMIHKLIRPPPPNTDEIDIHFLEQIESLLPHPERDEDASKGLWDTIIELHGRESVKINERHRTIEWQTRCLIARLLIYYDFLTIGLNVTK